MTEGTENTPARSPGRILVIDDEPALSKVTRTFLERLGGYTVCEVNFPTDAIKIVHPIQPEGRKRLEFCPCKTNFLSLILIGSMVTVAQAGVELESDFTGTSPGENLPWTSTSTLSTSMVFSGWTMGSGLAETATNNALGFYVKGNDVPSTLDDARVGQAYLSCTVAPAAAPLNLNGLQLNFRFRRHKWYAARQFAVYTSIGGFSDGNELYVSALFDNGDQSALDLSLFLPNTGYGAINSPLEIRVLPYAARYYYHEVSLEAFSMVSGISTHRLTLNASTGGVASRIPNVSMFTAGETAQVAATPDAGFRFAGWSGAITGKGNPRQLVMDADKNVTALFEPLPAKRMEVGQNLGGVTDWSTSYVFKDLFLRMRSWQTRDVANSSPWSTGLQSLIPVDANGWPTQVPFDPGNGSPIQLVHTILVTGNEKGDYTLFYEGSGSFEVRVDGGYRGYPVCDGTARTLPLVLGHQVQVTITINSSGPAPNHLRNFHLVPNTYLDDYRSDPFHPLFVERSAGFKVLRFMDWADTNNSWLEDWSDRTTTNHYTQARDVGVAMELMIQLCNLHNSDAWICIPHRANDAFVAQAAMLLHDNLNTNLKVYVEYSNELWNGIFSQANYASTEGIARGLSTTTWTAGRMYNALRSTEIWKIFNDRFGSSAEARVVKVLATQSASISVTQDMLAALNDPTVNTNLLFADALAIAPYFGHNYTTAELPPNVANYPASDDIAGVISIAAISNTVSAIAAQKAIADNQGMRLICYEGGQHFVGLFAAQSDDTLTAILADANRNPKMYLRYTEYLDMLQDAGVELFVNFSLSGAWSRSGSWGTLESMDQPLEDAVKYMAIKDWMAENLHGENLLKISSFTSSAQKQGLAWRSKPAHAYGIQTSTNLVGWSSVTNSVPSQGLYTTNLFSVSGDNDASFFQVIEE